MINVNQEVLDYLSRPASPEDASAYLIEIMNKLAHFAHISDLHNTSVMLSSAVQIAGQEFALHQSEMQGFQASWGSDPPIKPSND